MEYREDIPLRAQLQRYFGFQQFKGQQEAVIRNLLQGHDTFVLMPTGGGKSLCYQLPALMLRGTAVIISPLIALMKNQVDALRGYSEDDGVAHFLNSSLTHKQIQLVKADVRAEKTKLLYVAPESLTKAENVSFLRDIRPSFYAVDEAHCISEWGHDFRPEYRRIRPLIDEIGRAPIMALTATATPKVQDDILKNLEIDKTASVFAASFNRPNLFYEVRSKLNATREIIRYIKENPGKSGIIYCLSRKKVEQMAEVLQVNGIKALPYHAGMETALRSHNQDAFLQEQADVIVATIAFGMGIDKPDVRYVIHYDMPKSLEGYYQETGRAGRDGGEGRCIAFYTYKDVLRMERFIQGKSVSEQEVGRQLLLDTIDYAQGGDCRRKMLLHYFGEEYDQPNCGHCDNCVAPMRHFEGMQPMLTVLQVVQAIGPGFRAKHVVNIIMGQETTDTKMYEHFKLAQWALGRDQGEAYWTGVVRQACLHNYLSKEIQHYGLLRLTETGKAFLLHPHGLELVEDHQYDTQPSQEASVENAPQVMDDTLFKMLKGLRRDLAHKLNLPPYVIFQDPALEEMTLQYPVDLEQLTNISGVSLGKAKRYGQPFVELIARYVEEQEIDPPSAVVVRTVPLRSQHKVELIQCIDRKMDLEDLADTLGISFDDLLSDVESVVNSGVRLSIKYFVDQLVDQDLQADIYDFLRTQETSPSLDACMEAFKEDDITEQEMRMVRIQFTSEYAN